MNDEIVTNPEPTVEMTAETGVAEIEITDSVDVTEPTETPEPEIDLIDYEFNGKNLKIPAEIKDSLMMQADYTRKTQELADSRKAFEAQQSQAQQVNQEYVNDLAKLQMLDAQIAYFNHVDWSAASEQNAAQAQQLFFQLSQLKEQRGQLQQEIGAKTQQRQLEQQQLMAKQFEDGQRVLAEKIPDFTNKKSEIFNHAKTYGFSEQEVSQFVDPRAVQVLHDAMLYQQLKAKQSQTKPMEIKPASKVKTKAPATKDISQLSMAEFVKRRNKEQFGR